eukprot:11667657-Ditylum_brightwellii.AAC.1
MATCKKKEHKPDTMVSNNRVIKRGNSSQHFEGRSKELKGFVFDKDPRSADRFEIVKDKCSRFYGATFKHGNKVKNSIKLMCPPVIDCPEDPGDQADALSRALFA